VNKIITALVTGLFATTVYAQATPAPKADAKAETKPAAPAAKAAAPAAKPAAPAAKPAAPAAKAAAPAAKADPKATAKADNKAAK